MNLIVPDIEKGNFGSNDFYFWRWSIPASKTWMQNSNFSNAFWIAFFTFFLDCSRTCLAALQISRSLSSEILVVIRQPMFSCQGFAIWLAMIGFLKIIESLVYWSMMIEGRLQKPSICENTPHIFDMKGWGIGAIVQRGFMFIVTKLA